MYRMPIALKENRIVERYEWGRLLASDVRHLTLKPEDVAERYREESPLFRLLIPFGKTLSGYMLETGSNVSPMGILYQNWVMEHIIKVFKEPGVIFMAKEDVDCAILCMNMHRKTGMITVPNIRDLGRYKRIQLAAQAYFHPAKKPGAKPRKEQIHDPIPAITPPENQEAVV